MHRIDSEGSVDQMFSNGTGNEEHNQNGTALDAEWLNAVQEEICKLVQSGGLELRKGLNNQLQKAVHNTIAKELNPIIKELNEWLGYIKKATGAAKDAKQIPPLKVNKD